VNPDDPYDREQALHSFGDEEIFEQAVGIFLAEIDAMLALLEAGVRQRDFAAVKERAHWVKGGLVFLHAGPSTNAARSLERAAEGQCARTSATAFEELRREVDRLKASLRSDHSGPGIKC
jgi:HPt (histidine-containing phosphotransfer) domain-containing protein